MSDRPMNERVIRYDDYVNTNGLPFLKPQTDGEWVKYEDFAALEQERDKLRRVSEARYETEHAAANRWQEKYEAMKRIADAYHAKTVELSQERDRLREVIGEALVDIETEPKGMTVAYARLRTALEGGKDG